MMMADNEDKEEPYRKRSVSRKGRRCDGLHTHVNHARRTSAVNERLCTCASDVVSATCVYCFLPWPPFRSPGCVHAQARRWQVPRCMWHRMCVNLTLRTCADCETLHADDVFLSLASISQSGGCPPHLEDSETAMACCSCPSIELGASPIFVGRTPEL